MKQETTGLGYLAMLTEPIKVPDFFCRRGLVTAQFVPDLTTCRKDARSLAHKHSAERRAKGFSCRTQFVVMLFCQLARTDSLREICNGLSCCLEKLVHLGVRTAPAKSTLSYANKHLRAALFEDLFWGALDRSGNNSNWARARHVFVSKTNCSCWTPRPFPCACRFSHGPVSRQLKGVSSPCLARP